MGFLIGLLTVVMVLDCLILIFLVLIQLPKKDAGAGLAFGGSATDALFGAGSGNVLTKITKYAAGTFFALAIILSIVQSNYHRRTATAFQQKLEQPNKPVVSTMPPAPAAPATTPAAPATNAFRLSAPAESTNLPAPATKPATNPPSQK
ncbi:MAG: preprotein translocase subunit SecG [Verrucomicrobiota bacterium]